jgi:hypothetical protein
MRLKTWQMAVVGLLVAAGIGFSIFFSLARQAVRFEETDAATAHQQLERARASFASTSPILAVDEAGRLQRLGSPAGGARPPAERLMVLAYRESEGGLVRAEMPLWFLRLKAPVIRPMLRGAGLDPDDLGLTADELESLGRALLLDVSRPNGDRVLVWTE